MDTGINGMCSHTGDFVSVALDDTATAGMATTTPTKRTTKVGEKTTLSPRIDLKLPGLNTPTRIDPDTYSTGETILARSRKKGTYSITSNMSDSAARTTKQQTRSSLNNRAISVTDRTLDPVNGNYACRLITNPSHIPKRSVGRPRCQLHRWASNLEERSHVVKCNVCEVHLCIDCFDTFHTTINIVEKKQELCQYFHDNKKKESIENESLLKTSNEMGKDNSTMSDSEVPTKPLTHGSPLNKSLQREKHTRAIKFTDGALDPVAGHYACRLITDPPHMPKRPLANRPRCALHRWAADLEERPNVVLCSVCNTHLCIDCFDTFHTTINLVEKKQELCQYFHENKKKEEIENESPLETNNEIYTGFNGMSSHTGDDVSVDVVNAASRNRTNSNDTGNAVRTKKAKTKASTNIQRALKLNDRSLDPVNGDYACRLITDEPHWPLTPLANRPRCALHRWAADIEEKPHVVLCSVCNIHLCIDCFKPFHTTINLVAKKQELCQYFHEKKNKESIENDDNPIKTSNEIRNDNSNMTDSEALTTPLPHNSPLNTSIIENDGPLKTSYEIWKDNSNISDSEEPTKPRLPINPRYYSKQKRRPKEELRIPTRALRLTDRSVDPVNGKFACRLKSNPPHLKLISSRNRPKCALHSWAADRDVVVNIHYCSVCKLHLCNDCFLPFHLTENLLEKKYELCQFINEKKKRPRSKNKSLLLKESDETVFV